MFQILLAIAIVLTLVLNEIALVVITIRHIRRIQQREDEDDDATTIVTVSSSGDDDQFPLVDEDTEDAAEEIHNPPIFSN
jgi:uncharacterized membrane protein YcjF (UPF0283 family)